MLLRLLYANFVITFVRGKIDKIAKSYERRLDALEEKTGFPTLKNTNPQTLQNPTKESVKTFV